MLANVGKTKLGFGADYYMQQSLSADQYGKLAKKCEESPELMKKEHNLALTPQFMVLELKEDTYCGRQRSLTRGASFDTSALTEQQDHYYVQLTRDAQQPNWALDKITNLVNKLASGQEDHLRATR